MQHIAKTINAWLNDNLTDLPKIENDVFSVINAKDAVFCRYEPSSAVEKRYLDGSRSGVQILSYYYRSSSATKARANLEKIINALDTKDFIPIGENTSIYCEAVATPQFVELDEKNSTIYMATVKVEYYQDV